MSRHSPTANGGGGYRLSSGSASACSRCSSQAPSPPDIEAAQAILALAERVPAIDFLILGSVGLAFTDGRIPDNVQLVGPVSPQFKQDALAVADAALNPVDVGIRHEPEDARLFRQQRSGDLDGVRSPRAVGPRLSPLPAG